MRFYVFFIWLFLVFAVSGLLAQEPRLRLPLGHTGYVNDSEFSPDGKILATVSSDNTTRLWDVASGKLLNILEGSTLNVFDVQFSPDGKIIATASYDNTPRLWDVASGELLNTLEGHIGNVYTIQFSPDGKILATVSNDKTARLWDVTSGNLLHSFKGHVGYVNSAQFSTDGKILATASNDKTARLWDVTSGNLLHTFKGHVGYVNSAQFSPDGKILATASNDKTARLWDVTSGNLLHTLEGHVGYVNSAQFSPDGKILATTSLDKTIKLWDFSSGKLLNSLEGNTVEFSPDRKTIATLSDSIVNLWNHDSQMLLHVLKGHSGYVNSIKFSPDGKILATTSNDRITLWDVNNGVTLKSLKSLSESIKSTQFNSDGKMLSTTSWGDTICFWDVSYGRLLNSLVGNTVEFSPDRKTIATLSDSTVKLWNHDSQKLLHVLKGHSGYVNSIKFSPDGKILATTSNDKTARLWDVNNGITLKSLKSHNKIYYAEFSPDGKTIAISSLSDSTRILDIFSGTLLNTFDGYKPQFNSNGKILATISKDTIAQLWDITSGCLLHTLEAHNDWITSVQFSPDGKILATTSNDKTARLWDVTSGKILHILYGHFWKVTHAHFSSDGKTFATASYDKTARLWDVDTGKLLYNLKGHNDRITSAQFSPNKKTLFTASDDGKTILWDATTGKALYTRLQLKNGDWLVYDEHYRYDGTQGARDYLYFVCGLEVMDLAQVKDALYVPNLVQRIMNGENLDHLPKLKDLEICGVSPEVEPIDNNKDGGNYYKITPRKGGVGNIEIYINGALRQTIDSKKLKLQNGIYELKVDEKLIQQFETAGEETEIKVIAKTADNKISSRGVITESVTEVQKTYRKPHLHAVLVGIDDYKGEGLDLNYAAKDAIDLQKAMETSSKKLFNIDDTNRVHFYNLSVDRTGKISGRTPDRNNILQAIEKIAVESKPEDVMLIFFAGHGEINKNKQLILLTADASKEQAPDYSGITIKELLEKLTTVPAGKRILLLDACHSGAAINELNLKDIAGVRNGEDAEKQTQRLKELENLASKSGLSIITASSSDQKAMELPQYEHGLMTYALLTTMMNEPNVLDKDNNLQIEDWLRETERAVSRLIENQSAQRFVPLNFSIGKVDEEVRKSVDLKEIPTIVVANVFNRNTDDDELEIKSKLKKLLNESATRGTDKILISEKENSNTISVIVSYEIIEGKIESRISLKKNKVVIKQFNFSGKENDVSGFVKGLGEEIFKNIRL